MARSAPSRHPVYRPTQNFPPNPPHSTILNIAHHRPGCGLVGELSRPALLDAPARGLGRLSPPPPRGAGAVLRGRGCVAGAWGREPASATPCLAARRCIIPE